ncbi:hypothetical protein IC830_08075 [Vibrio parahaemolyticus]|nr:hypothetical protein IC830_08075 [Vibrio parahaemolyticus]
MSNGVLFTGDAVTEILTCLQAKQAKNDTIPFELNISAQPILAWFRSPLKFWYSTPDDTALMNRASVLELQ